MTPGTFCTAKPGGGGGGNAPGGNMDMLGGGGGIPIPTGGIPPITGIPCGITVCGGLKPGGGGG